jgi:hypothetical protein
MESISGINRLIYGVEVALTFRSPLAWRILAAVPMDCLRVELAPEDVPTMQIADGRWLADWTKAVISEQADSGAHVRALAHAGEPVQGPLTCTASLAEGSRTDIVPPLVIFDGWHRAAAWVAQLGCGAHYPITANLVVTRKPVPLLPIG